MSANDGPEGERTIYSAVPSPSPPDCNDVLVPLSFGVAPPTATAVIDGRHCSLVIVPLLQTVAVIVLVLVLPPKRTPISDRDFCPRRATYGNNGGPASICVRAVIVVGPASYVGENLIGPRGKQRNEQSPVHSNLTATRPTEECLNAGVQAPIKIVDGRHWSPGVYHNLRLMGFTLEVAWARVFISLTFIT